MTIDDVQELLREYGSGLYNAHAEFDSLSCIDGMEYIGLEEEDGKIVAVVAYEKDSLEMHYCSDARIRSVISLGSGGGDTLTKRLFDGGLDVDFIWGAVERGSRANIVSYLSRYADQIPLEIFDTKVDFGRDLVFYWKPLNADENNRRAFIDAIMEKFGRQ